MCVALSLAGYTILSDDLEVTQDNLFEDGSKVIVTDDFVVLQGDDSDSDEAEIWPLSSNKYSFLNMNLSTKSMKQQFLTLPNSKELRDLKEFNPLNVNIHYLYLMDAVYKLLESYDPSLLVGSCARLMASDTHNITLFNSKTSHQLNEYDDMFIFKILMCYSSWYDYSVVKKLLEMCECFEGLKLLEQFESKIDFSLPITHFPICVPSFLMMPSETSDFAVMNIYCVQEHSLLPLNYIREVKSLISKISDLNDTCCQFIAKRDNPVILFWLVPRNVVSHISTKVQESYVDLYNSGIIVSFTCSYVHI